MSWPPEDESAPTDVHEYSFYLGQVSATEALGGDAGSRRYFRIRFSDGMSEIVCQYPYAQQPRSLGSAYWRFVYWNEFLLDHGLAVPEITRIGPGPFIALRDLGPDTPGIPPFARQLAAIDWIRKLATLPIPQPAFPLNHFGMRKLGFETVFFLKAVKRILFSPALGHWAENGSRKNCLLYRDNWPAMIRPVVDYLHTIDRLMVRETENETLCHRDFHTRNVMFGPAGEPIVIDFQDMMLAPPEYDLASFVFDPYKGLTAAQAGALISRYYPEGLPARRREFFAVVARQRLWKCLGTYLHYGFEPGKFWFIGSIAPALEHLGYLENHLPGGPPLNPRVRHFLGTAHEIAQFLSDRAREIGAAEEVAF